MGLGRALVVVLTVCLAAVGSGCGGGGGSGGGADVAQPPATGGDLRLRAANLADGTIAMSTSATWLFDFDAELDSTNLATFVQLSDARGTVPLSVDLLSGSLRVQPAQPLRMRSDHTLTIKAGLKGRNGAVLRSDITRRFKSILFDGVSQRVAPQVPGLTNYPGQHTIRLGDLNGDGRPDIVQIGGDPSLTAFGDVNNFAVKVYLQNPDHSFRLAQNLIIRETQFAYANSMGDIAIVDLDHDGVPEIAIGMQRALPGLNGVMVLKQDALGRYAVADFIPSNVTHHLFVVDVDRDGRPDLLGIGQGRAMTDGPDRCGMAAILSSQAGARPQAPTLLPCGGFEALVGALQPGQLQLVLLRPWLNPTQPVPVSSRLSIYTLDAQGRPTLDVGLMAAAAPVCAGLVDCSGLMLMDANGDGVQDLLVRNALVTELSVTTIVYARSSQGAYAELTRQNFGDRAYALMIADMDRDGLDDVVVVVQLPSSFIAGGFGTRGGGLELTHLVPVDTFDTMNQSTVAIGDIDGDGWPDVVLSSYNLGLTVLFQRRN
jgi:hypothetical protein